MRKIDTKFGTIYIEDLEYDRHRTNWREEEDRIKIFDSDERYCDYWSMDTIIENAEYDQKTLEEEYEWIIEHYENADSLDCICPDMCYATKSFKEMYIYMCIAGYFDEDRRKNILQALDNDDLTDDFLLSNEWVNHIGDYYILVSEY